MNEPLLRVENLRVNHGGHTLLALDDWHIQAGSFVAILGPNGAGKTTLLHALAGGLRHDGSIHYQNRPLHEFGTAALATKRAVLGQNPHIAFPLDVAALVRLGREPYRNSPCAAHDRTVCDWAIHSQELQTLAARNSQQLSGGEQHRAHIARILAQTLPALDSSLKNKYLLLDEPTNHLDIRHQYRLLGQLAALKARGLTIIAILHDPVLALNHADRLLLLKNGQSRGEYSAEETVRGGHLDCLYGIPMHCCRSANGRNYTISPCPGEDPATCAAGALHSPACPPTMCDENPFPQQTKRYIP